MLRKLLAAACCVGVVVVAKADEGRKIIPSKVKKVIVFLNGAQVTRTATATINAGTSDLVFGGIPPGIDANSIQVHAAGPFTILSVKNETGHLTDLAGTKQIAALEYQQKAINDKINQQNILQGVYKAEENTLMKNQFMTPEKETLDVVKLQQALDFQTARLTSIREKELTVSNQLVDLNAELRKCSDQLYELNSKQNRSTINIVVTVSSKTALQSEFFLSYLIHSAGWYPSYDIRAKDVHSPLTIAYKANVTQTSGEDWKNVRLVLSTGNPTINAVKPELTPYYLNLASNYRAGKRRGDQLAEVVVAGYAAGVASTVPLDVNQVERQTNVEFDIANPYTISSDGKAYQAEIKRVEMKADYQYDVVPKLSTNVFLTAQVTGWGKYNFLPGDANLFFEGTYVGKSKIDTRTLNDTLNLSLGIDRSILVTRVLQKDFSQRQSIGSNQKETRDWIIDIKNRKNEAINLLVEDEIPVSQNSAIAVEPLETSGAKPDASTGKVSWNLLLNSQAEKKLELKYQVKYPKNQFVLVQ